MTPLELFHLVSSWALGFIVVRAAAKLARLTVDKMSRIARKQNGQAAPPHGDHDVILAIRLRVRAADRFDAAELAQNVTTAFLQALPTNPNTGVVEAGYAPNPFVMPVTRKRVRASWRYRSTNPSDTPTTGGSGHAIIPAPKHSHRDAASDIDIDGQIFDDRSRKCSEFPHVHYRIGQTCKSCQWVIGTSPARFVS